MLHLVLLVEGFPHHIEDFIEDFKSRKFGDKKPQNPTVREVKVYNIVTREENMPYVIGALKNSPNYGYGFRKHFTRVFDWITKLVGLKKPKEFQKKEKGFKFRGLHFEILGMMDDPRASEDGTKGKHEPFQELT